MRELYDRDELTLSVGARRRNGLFPGKDSSELVASSSPFTSSYHPIMYYLLTKKDMTLGNVIFTHHVGVFRVN